MGLLSVLEKATLLSAEFAQQRAARLCRTEADPTDFERLRAVGVHLAAVPVGYGGLWEGLRRSVRPICEVLRILAHGDPSVALVTSMHPLVLSSWREARVPAPFRHAWAQQQRWVFDSVLGGAWWGTIISEPGSGGDPGQTRTVAQLQGPSDLDYRITGAKHFGSGSGVTSYMITTAVPQGETEPDLFVLKVKGAPWDGSTGMRLLAPWDGHGMTSTNSHAFAFQDFPATRIAWPGHWKEIQASTGAWGGLAFAAVIVGVVETAMAFTRQELQRRGSPKTTMRPFEQVQWTLAEQEAWLLQQAYEGALRTLKREGRSPRTLLLAKESVAQLAQSVLTRLTQIGGGAAYSRHSPLGFWLEDVRALGFLRPPWGLAFDRLFELSWEE